MEVIDKPTSPRKCSEITGIPYGWLLEQLKGFDPPPHYVRPGCKRPQVIPSEVMEWFKKKGATK